MQKSEFMINFCLIQGLFKVHFRLLEGSLEKS